MLVHSLWDQEDIYGAPAVYKAIEPKDTATTRCSSSSARGITARRSATAARSARSSSAATRRSYFRREILRPFLDQYLKDDAPKADVAPVMAFETGTNTWRRLTAWPSGCASGCSVEKTPLYLARGLAARFAAPEARAAPSMNTSPIPAKPVPFRARPDPSGRLRHGSWSRWLVDDQREASGRPDVLAFMTDAARPTPVKISGAAGRQPRRLDERH